MSDRFTVPRLNTCNRCGSSRVYWCRSFKTGRPYLVDVREDGTAARNAFHSCQYNTTASDASTMRADNVHTMVTAPAINQLPLEQLPSHALDVSSAEIAIRHVARVEAYEHAYPEVVAIAHDVADSLIQENRQAILDKLNASFHAPSESAPSPHKADCNSEACEVTWTPAKQLKSAKQPSSTAKSTNSTKRAIYACTSSPNIKLEADVVPGKAKVCKHCNRPMKFLRLA